MRNDYDVVVVGAGPAGASAAYHAASAGLKTLLLDRKRFPRAKVCGDWLTPRAVRALARIGLGHAFDAHTRVAGVRMQGSGVDLGVSYAAEPPPYDFGLVVPRSVLDQQIATAAVSAGAEFVDDVSVEGVVTTASERIAGVAVRHPRKTSSVRARVTIVADGATGRIGRLLTGTISARHDRFCGTAVFRWHRGRRLPV